MLMLRTDKVEEFVRSQADSFKLVTHNIDHLFRTANGAAWFVKVMGGDREEQDMAYIAGLLHDIVRPATEKVCHAEASAVRTEEVLREFGMEPGKIEMIVKAVRDHRKKPERWESPLHQSVYLADKILEQMGAFVVFRRAVWVKELKDYEGVPFWEAFAKQTRVRVGKFNVSAFPERFHKLTQHQFDWHRRFLDFVESKEPWALRLVEWCYQNGTKYKDMDGVIGAFKPQSPEEERYHKEAVDYIQGKKWEEFEKLV